MVEWAIERIFPDFILADRNGYALARAIDSGLRILCEAIQTGMDTMQDIEKMPEWRLDEMAWEMGCLYDAGASIENKRIWIRNAAPYYATMGTPGAIYNYLNGYFDQVRIEEGTAYGCEPYHFRVWVSGEMTHEKAEWIQKAISAAKNVRSVLDDVSVGGREMIRVRGRGEIAGRIDIPRCGEIVAGDDG